MIGVVYTEERSDDLCSPRPDIVRKICFDVQAPLNPHKRQDEALKLDNSSMPVKRQVCCRWMDITAASLFWMPDVALCCWVLLCNLLSSIIICYRTRVHDSIPTKMYTLTLNPGRGSDPGAECL